MTEKVRITQEQATALEYLRDTKFHDEGIIASHARRPMGWEANYTESLNGLPLLTLVDALRIGYEVEEEYKVGDWVVSKHTGAICKISKIENNKLWGLWGVETHVLQYNPKQWVRHATPEENKAEQERRLWKKIGREVGEFRIGDAYEYRSNGSIFTVDVRNRGNTAKAAYETGQLKGFYPAESFISFFGGDPDA